MDDRVDGEIVRLILAGKLSPAMTFRQRVWAVTARIPRGKVTTYGEVARALGSRAARAVGVALNQNPYAPRVPCHRVVGADGRLVGFAGGLAKKQELLEAEGIEIVEGRVDLERFGVDLNGETEELNRG